MRLAGIVILVIAGFAFACPASAQPVFPQQGGSAPTPPPAAPPGALLTEMTADQVVQLMNAASFPSKVAQDDKQNKWVTTNFWGENLYSGVLLTGDCDKGGCDILNYFANFGKSPTVNQAWINAWNQSKCCVKAFLLSDQSLVFEYDLPLLTGVTSDYVTAAAQGFKSVVDTAANFKP